MLYFLFFAKADIMICYFISLQRLIEEASLFKFPFTFCIIIKPLLIPIYHLPCSAMVQNLSYLQVVWIVINVFYQVRVLNIKVNYPIHLLFLRTMSHLLLQYHRNQAP